MDGVPVLLGKGDASLSRCIPLEQGFTPCTCAESLRAPCDP